MGVLACTGDGDGDSDGAARCGGFRAASGGSERWWRRHCGRTVVGVVGVVGVMFKT